MEENWRPQWIKTVNFPFQLLNDVRNSSVHPGRWEPQQAAHGCLCPNRLLSCWTSTPHQQDFLGHILLGIHWIIPAIAWNKQKKKKVKSSWNISIYGSLNPQSFPKKRSERRNVAFVCRLTGTHASLSNSLTELRAEQAPGNADCYGGEKSKELQFQSPLHFRSVPLVCDTCLQVKTKEK